MLHAATTGLPTSLRNVKNGRPEVDAPSVRLKCPVSVPAFVRCGIDVSHRSVLHVVLMYLTVPF